MTTEPPLNAPWVQVNPICCALLIVNTETKLVGASGLVEIIAPLPMLDTTEYPTLFWAVTLATILDPQVRLNGAA